MPSLKSALEPLRIVIGFAWSAVTLVVTIGLPVLVMAGELPWRPGHITWTAVAAAVTTVSVMLGWALVVTGVVGVPMWLVLRAMQRTTLRAHAVAGALGGAIAVPAAFFGLQMPYGNWLLPVWLWACFAGAVSATVFWRIVLPHDRRTRDAS